MGGTVFIFILVAGLIIAFAVYAHKKEQERIQALAAYVADEGGEFYPHAASLDTGFWSKASGIPVVMEIVSLFASCKPFGEGHSRRASHLMLFPAEPRSQLLAFDYEYKITTSNGKSTQTTTYPFRLVFMKVDMVLPSLSLEPEHIGHRIAEKFGMSEIEFELDEFNRRFFVRSPDRQGTFALLNPQMMEFLLTIHPLRLECSGNAMMLVESGKLTVADVHRMREKLVGFRDHIPEFLWDDRQLGRAY